MILTANNRQIYQINYSISNEILFFDPTLSNGIILGNDLSDWENRLRNNPATQRSAIQDYTTRLIDKVLPEGFLFNTVTTEIKTREEWIKAIQTCYDNPYIIDEFWRREGRVPLLVIKSGYDLNTIQNLGALGPIIEQNIGRFWSQSLVVEQNPIIGQTVYTYSTFLMFILANGIGDPRQWWTFGIQSLQYRSIDNTQISSNFNPINRKTWAMHADNNLSYVDFIELSARMQLFEDLSIQTPDTFSVNDFNNILLGKYLKIHREDLVFKLPQYILSYDSLTRQTLPINMVI